MKDDGTREMDASRLSAGALFHFTDSFKKLRGILEDNLHAHYCLENLEGLLGPDTNAVGTPMVCFCDIRLSQIRNHVRRYGPYGLGLKKEWGIRNDITPVWYYLPSTRPTAHLGSGRRMLENLFRIGTPDRPVIGDAMMLFDTLITHSKPYDNGLDGNEYYRFYDEREWRYVPSRDSLLNDHLCLPLLEHEFHRKRNLDSKLAHRKHHLHFEPNDVLYVLVEKESEVYETVGVLKGSKEKKYSKQEVILITTRIISMERIFQDF